MPCSCCTTWRTQSSTVLKGCSGWASRLKLKSDGPKERQSTPGLASLRTLVISAFDNLPGIRRGRHGDAKIHVVSPLYVQCSCSGMLNALLAESQRHLPSDDFR